MVYQQKNLVANSALTTTRFTATLPSVACGTVRFVRLFVLFKPVLKAGTAVDGSTRIVRRFYLLKGALMTNKMKLFTILEQRNKARVFRERFTNN